MTMLMKEIMEYYQMKDETISEKYERELKESVEAAELARKNETPETVKDAKEKSIRCSRTMATMIILNQIDDFWNGIPIMFDRIMGEECYTPVGEDSPDRSAVMIREDGEGGDDLEIYFVSGHNRNLEKTHFMTFATGREAAISMIKGWMVYARLPGELR